MKTDLYTKAVLSVIALLLFLNLLTGSLFSTPATAQQPNSQIERYQISAWASPIGIYGHHAGYYILDTTTGKIFDKGEEVHVITPKK
jgi:hypothetical protein